VRGAPVGGAAQTYTQRTGTQSLVDGGTSFQKWGQRQFPLERGCLGQGSYGNDRLFGNNTLAVINECDVLFSDGVGHIALI
jgi:hypothetical protein